MTSVIFHHSALAVQWTDRPPDRPLVAGIRTEDTPVMQTIISVMFC